MAGAEDSPADFGSVFATLTCRLDGNMHDPSYQTKDGDAAYLDAGTPIYRVNGYVPTFRLVARFAGQLTFYEADTDPRARIGADLLTIGGRVTSISIMSQQDDTPELGAFRDSKQVASLVAMVLGAPADERYPARDSPTYFIAFHLNDSTVVTRAYWLSSGELARGILPPTPFGIAIQRAVTS